MRRHSLKFQEISDNFINKVFLRFIPRAVKPNHVTYIRFALVPIVYFFLIKNKLDIALWIFILAACTDFIDGAMARTRDQITDLGKVIDPVADKLLVFVVLLYLGFEYTIVKIFLIVIIIELLAIIFGAVFSFAIGRPVGANIFGKIKMILQSVSVVSFLFGIMIKDQLIINISEYVLMVSLVFAIISGFAHVKRKLGHGNRNA
jgi:CDP-diacylglycerol--glycerol-3-phosphate 3-phosphatidyltransferase